MSKRIEWEGPTPETLEWYRAIGGWDEALYLAAKYDTAKLSAYLRRRDLPWDDDHRWELAELIDRLIHRRKEIKGRKLGRKPGRIPPPNRDKYTTDDVVYFARKRLDWIRQRNGGKAPRGSYKAAITHVCQRLGDEGEPFEVNERQALKMLKRGRR
jgi:hypothetical protein